MKFLLWSFLVEAIIFTVSYFATDSNIAEAFRYAARYSGKLSFLVYVFCAFHFVQINRFKVNQLTKSYSLLFAWLHLIHLGFLLTNLWLNKIEIVPLRLLGGVLAYGMIIVYPFVLYKLKRIVHLVYYYYVGLIMLLTFAARATGKFVGVTPNINHYIGIAATLALFVWMGIRAVKRQKFIL